MNIIFVWIWYSKKRLFSCLCKDTRNQMEVPKVDKIQLTREQEKEVRKTLELVLIQEHSKGKVRYVFNDDTEITTHVTIAAQNICACAHVVIARKMACFRAVRIKLSHKVYKPHQPVSHGVLKPSRFFDETQNKMANQKDELCVCNVMRSFPFPYKFFLAYFAWRHFVFLFSFEIFRRKLTHNIWPLR